jgi:putative peptide zinc metalloprotease protein
MSIATYGPEATDRLRVRVRPDLVIQKQLYEGQTHYVVKDPVGMRYFRFRIEEHFLLQRFDGKRRLSDIKDDYEAEFRPQKITIEELARFAAQLTQAGLTIVDSPGQGQLLFERYRKYTFRRRLAAWSNVLYIKIPVFDPDRLLERMLPYFRWIYSPYCVVATLLFWAAAGIWVAAHYDTFLSRLPKFDSFFNWRNAFYMWLALGAVKIIHEFGHGLTCKYFGGECHEMGALFLVLSPCLYCDVSDSWLLPSKWQRMWIGAAGIYVELSMAALCTFVWWNTTEGLLNTVALSIMFICSVNTVLFNGNPLLRYDGYYMLMDVMEVPNLRQKATQFFTNVFQKVCLGLPTQMDTYLPRARRLFFFSYAVASYFYRWFISIAILLFMYHFLRPYKLAVLSEALAAASLFSLLFVPTYQLGKHVFTSQRATNVSKFRLSLTLAVAGGVLAFLCFVPLPYRLYATFRVEPTGPEFVWVKVAGRLDELLVREGDPVQEGALLARLVNVPKVMEYKATEAEAQKHDTLAKHYARSREDTGRDKALEIQLAADFQKRADELKKEIGWLELRAPRNGVVMRSPEAEKKGATLEVGTPFCQVADPQELEARLYIDQTDIDLVRDGQKVALKFYALPEETVDGEILSIAKIDAQSLPPEMSNQAGGEIATKTDPQTQQQVPLSTTYEAVVRIPKAAAAHLAPGFRGKAKIYAERTTLVWRAWRLIRRTLTFS